MRMWTVGEEMAEYRSTLILDCDIQMTNRVELEKEKKKRILKWSFIIQNQYSKSINKDKKKFSNLICREE